MWAGTCGRTVAAISAATRICVVRNGQLTAGNVRVKGLALTFKFGVAADGHEVELVLRPLVHRHGSDKATVGTGPTLPRDEEDLPRNNQDRRCSQDWIPYAHLRCTPRERCTPEHLRQMNVPRVTVQEEVKGQMLSRRAIRRHCLRTSYPRPIEGSPPYNQSTSASPIKARVREASITSGTSRRAAGRVLPCCRDPHQIRFVATQGLEELAGIRVHSVRRRGLRCIDCAACAACLTQYHSQYHPSGAKAVDHKAQRPPSHRHVSSGPHSSLRVQVLLVYTCACVTWCACARPPARGGRARRAPAAALASHVGTAGRHADHGVARPPTRTQPPF